MKLSIVPSNSKKTLTILTAILVIFIFIPLLSNLKGILNNCFHAYDLGLYQQAFYNMANGDLNPYLTIRGLNIFNDHFMPIIFTSIPFVWAFDYHPSSMIFLEWSYYILFLICIYFTVRKRPHNEIIFALFMAIFSKGILSALEFPIHPGTWSMFSWLILIYYIYKNNEKGIFIFSVFTCLFRESYPFSFFMLSLYYLYRKQFKLGSALLAFSVLYLSFIMKLRPLFLGPVYDYGGWIVEGLVRDPIDFFLNSFIKMDWKVPFKIFAPFIIPIVLVFKRNSINWSNKLIPCLLLLIPLFAMHFITGQFHFHYGPPFMAVLIGYLIYDENLWQVIKNKKLKYFIIFIFLITASSRYTKFIKFLATSKNNSCVVNDEKSESIQKLLLKTNLISNDEILLSTGGVIQRIMRPGLKVYPPNTMVKVPEVVNYLLFEKNSNGDTYPWNKEQVNRAIDNCRKVPGEIIFDDDYFFLMKGSFTKQCYSVY
jgi:uncharacterized membrane protein